MCIQRLPQLVVALYFWSTSYARGQPIVMGFIIIINRFAYYGSGSYTSVFNGNRP